MGNRYTRKKMGSRLKAEGSSLRNASARQAKGPEGPRVIACGKINKHGRETRIAFEFMSKLSQGAVRRVFGENTARGEEIANA